MNAPNVGHVMVPGEELREDNRNGYAYWMYLPAPAAPLTEALPEVAQYGDFEEMPVIIDALQNTDGVLVTGAPGSGKSHLVRDIQTACFFNNIPTFCLTLHVNGGKGEGVDNIRPYIEEFREKSRETGGGVVILDNIDYVGYRGKSRSHAKAAKYAEAIEPLVEELLDDSQIKLLATAHDEEWRAGRWTWEDPAIDEPADAILNAFPSCLVFDGKMALEGLAHLLWVRSAARAEGEPPITISQAAQVIRHLSESRRANFFHANHLDVGLFLHDPNAAIAELDRGREERRGKS